MPSADKKPSDRPPVLAWRPGRDTAWALLSIPLMWLCYWLNTQFTASQPIVATLIFFVVGNLVVSTALPAWVVTRVAGEGWAGLGFTRRRLWLALLVTAVLGFGSLQQYLAAAQRAGVDPLEHLAYNLVILWEPLFVYGWLQLRFTRAFGWLPAIVLTALGFAAYHIGSVPPETLLVFAITGVVYAAFMALTRNLWSLFPLAAGVSSGIGTLQSGLSFTWSVAAVGVVVLIAQAVILWWVVGRRRAPVAAPAA